MSTSPLRRLTLSTAAIALLAGGAFAQQAPVMVPSELDAVSVTADRTEKPIGDATSSVSVKTAKEIERKGVHRMQDLVKDEPGVTGTNDGMRAGNGGYTIRGISDNRILMMVDGERLPDLPGGVLLRGGGFTPYTRDTIEFDTLRQAEIVRGPASALYGSDAMGGVVSYVTKSPSDVLAPGRDTFTSLKTTYDSKDRSLAETATVAGRSGAFSALAIYTRRDGEEYKTKADDYNAAGQPLVNPQETSGNNLLGKLIWDGADDRITFTGEYFQRSAITDLRTDRTATRYDSDADDTSRRWRLSLGHVHDAPIGFIDKLDWKLYYTRQEREDNRTRKVLVTGVDHRDIYEQTSEQNIFGADLQLTSNADWGSVTSTFTYGGSVSYTATERLREFRRINAVTGALVTTTIPGEGAPTPSRFFPNTGTIQGGAFVQDEIKTGGLTVIPAIRVDVYHMNPNPDAIYNNNPVTTSARTINEVAASPKLGAAYELTDNYSVFGQYARGFRAPPYDDANAGFANAPFPGAEYAFVPNPDLKPETSNGFEAGIRGKYENGSSFQISSFYNLYKNFISMVNTGATATYPGGVYQAQNLSKVEIYGAEAKGDWRFIPNWSLSGSTAWAMGFNKDTGDRLDSVAPLTLRAGLRYDAPEELWGAGISATHVEAKKHVDVTGAGLPGMETPSYTTVDLAAYYNPLPFLSLSASLNNLFDQSYYSYINVTGVADNSTVKDRYLETGRSITVSATLKW
jgi:hemoglobin/transferrin/lactoferrin receptor protein